MTSPASPRQQPPSSWRSHPRFIILTIATGQFSDLFLFSMRVPLLPYLIRSHLPQVPEAEVQSRVATLLASFGLALLAVAVPAGWLADLHEKWRGRLYLGGLAALFWATVTFYTSREFGMMVGSRVLNGASAAVLYAAGFAMVADAVGPGDLGKAFGTIRSIVAVGDLVGPPLGGIVFARWGFDGILNVSLMVLAVDLVLRLLMVERPRNLARLSDTNGSISYGMIESRQPSSVSKKPVGFRSPLPILFCLSDSQLVVALVLGFIQYVILGSYDSTLSLEASTRFGLSPNVVGAVFLGLAIPVLVFAPLAGWAVDRFGPRKIATIGYGCFAPALAGMVIPTRDFMSGPFPRFPTFFGFLVLQGVCVALVSTPGVVKAKQAVEKAVQANPHRFGPHGAMGQMFGLNTLVSSAGLLTGNYWGAVLTQAFGYWFMSLGLAGLCVLAAFLAWTFFSDVQEKEAKPASVV